MKKYGKVRRQKNALARLNVALKLYTNRGIASGYININTTIFWNAWADRVRNDIIVLERKLGAVKC